MSINKAIITGNITRDAEVRNTASGMCICNFSVAVNDRRKNQNGDWDDVPNYIDCVMFGNRAQSLSQYLAKGTKVGVEGKLRWSQWEERDTGKKRSKVEVMVDDIELLSSKQQGVNCNQVGGYQQGSNYQQGGQRNQYQNGGNYNNGSQRNNQYNDGGMYAEDVPF